MTYDAVTFDYFAAYPLAVLARANHHPVLIINGNQSYELKSQHLPKTTTAGASALKCRGRKAWYEHTEFIKKMDKSIAQAERGELIPIDVTKLVYIVERQLIENLCLSQPLQ